MNLLARREHSRQELRDKLARCGYAPEVISSALDTLESEGLLQDWRFAEAYVASRSMRGFGPVKIRLEMKQRGLSAELIDRYCDSRDPCWREHAVNAWKKRFAQTPADNFSAWAKQARYLQQRGFDTAHIHAALGEYDE